MIAGERILFYPGFKVISGGYLTALIHPNECCLPLSPPVRQEQTSKLLQQHLQPSTCNLQPRVYPNPTSGSFRVLMDPMDKSTMVTCEVYNSQGMVIRTVAGKWGEFPEISLAGEKPGLYVVRIGYGSGGRMLKVVLIN